jgi:ParB-like chromosome segregation protein Spo0J
MFMGGTIARASPPEPKGRPPLRACPDDFDVIFVEQPYARNSRTHTDEQVAQIAASIREFGWTNPVLLDEQDGIIAGHGRVLAARKLGAPTVPCIVLDGLTEAQKRAYVIADNKLALNAGWDEELLAIEWTT